MFLLDHPDPLSLWGILLLPLLFLYFYPSKSSFPLINPNKKLDVSDKTSKTQFVTNARGLIEAGLAKVFTTKNHYPKTLLTTHIVKYFSPLVG
jgi:hypothetical protein